MPDPAAGQPAQQIQPEITDVDSEQFVGKRTRVVFWDMGWTKFDQARFEEQSRKLRAAASASCQ